MILRRLVEYAERLEAGGELTPVMYAEMPVRWQINLKEDGDLEGFLPLGGDRKDNKRGNSLTVPNVVRAAGIKPKLLVDNGEYVLGIGRPGADAAKVAERHRRFVDLVRRCADETREESVRAVCEFLERWDGGEFTDGLHDDLDPRTT